MGHKDGTKIIVADALKDYPEREIIIIYTSPKNQQEQCHNIMAWIKLLRAGFHYKYTQIIYQQKEPGIKVKPMAQKYLIDFICGGRKPIQLVTYRDKL